MSNLIDSTTITKEQQETAAEFLDYATEKLEVAERDFDNMVTISIPLNPQNYSKTVEVFEEIKRLASEKSLSIYLTDEDEDRKEYPFPTRSISVSRI